jgi:hypothetical protein
MTVPLPVPPPPPEGLGPEIVESLEGGIFGGTWDSITADGFGGGLGEIVTEPQRPPEQYGSAYDGTEQMLLTNSAE